MLMPHNFIKAIDFIDFGASLRGARALIMMILLVSDTERGSFATNGRLPILLRLDGALAIVDILFKPYAGYHDAYETR